MDDSVKSDSAERLPPTTDVRLTESAGSAAAATGDSAPARDRLPTIPGYEVLGKLGAGGMGVVYQARHSALHRLVAIKVLRRIQEASEREVARLQIEGETVANLQHPNIVQLYQLGELAGLPFLAFEYVDGGTLAERIAGKPQAPRAAAEMVELLANAVQAAHQQGVLHRDLKPANVLLSKEGVPKIADFGLARRMDNAEYSTELIAGTASYMSPEQAWGDSRTNPLTPATDVYSLGAILYELLTGKPPFDGDSREQVIKDVWNKSPPPPRVVAADIPADLQTICLKCLEKEPNRRYASAGELADDLHRYLHSEPILARPTGRFERALLWCRRDPLFAGLAAGLIVAILAGLAASSWLTGIYREKSNEAERNASEARHNAERATLKEAEVGRANQTLTAKQQELETANDKLERRLYESLILTIAQDLERLKTDPQGPARLSLARHLAECPKRLRDIEWNIRNRQLQGSLLTRPITSRYLAAMDLSPDGTWVATATVDVADFEKRAWMRFSDGRAGPEQASPLGLADYYELNDDVQIWSTSDWQRRTTVRKHGERLKFSPDGRWLVIANPSSGVEVWDWQNEKLIRTFACRAKPAEVDEHGDPLFQPVEGVAVFRPDGKQLAIGLDGGVQFYPIDGVQIAADPEKTALPTGPAMALAYSPVGERLIVLAYRGRQEAAPHRWQAELQIWNSRDGELIRKEPLEGTYRLMCLSPDGRTCTVAMAPIGSLHPWGPLEVKVYELDGDGVRKFVLGYPPRALQFSRDGATILVANEHGQIDLIDAARLEPKATLLGHTGEVVVAVDSLADGRILSAGADGALKVWPADGLSRLPHWYPGHLPYALGPDGRELAVAQDDGSIRRFDLDANVELPSLPPQQLARAGGDDARADGDDARAEQPATALGVGGLCYASPERLLVAYSDLTLRAWVGDRPIGEPVVLTGPGLTRPNPQLAQAEGYFAATGPEPRIVFSADARYAAWPGRGQTSAPGSPRTALMVWRVESGETIVNQFDRFGLSSVQLLSHFEFVTLAGEPWAVFSERMPTVLLPGRPYEPGSLVSGWNLATGEHSATEHLERDMQAARPSRLLSAFDVLTIADSATGVVLLELPLGATAVERPRLCDDRSRLAVATDRNIAVFDVDPLPQFVLPTDAPAPAPAADGD